MIPCQSPTGRYQTLQILRQGRIQILLAEAMWLLKSLNQTTMKWTQMTGYPPDLSDVEGVGLNHAVKFFRGATRKSTNGRAFAGSVLKETSRFRR